MFPKVKEYHNQFLRKLYQMFWKSPAVVVLKQKRIT